MAFWRRLWDIVRGSADAALDRVEDPEKSLGVAIQDMTAEVAEFRTRVAGALVDEKRLAADLQGAVRRADEWRGRAEAAVDAGDDDLAREALTRQAEQEREAKERYQALEQHSRIVADLKDALRDLNRRLEEARRKRNLLVARARGAKARKKMAEALGGTGGGSFERFSELEQKVDTLEAEAGATVELLGELAATSDRALEERFRALKTRDPAIEESLRALKARLPATNKTARLGPAPGDGSGREGPSGSG